MPPKATKSTDDTPTSASTPSTVLTEREINLVCYAVAANPNVLSGVDCDALAKMTGYKNPRSVSNALRVIRQKLKEFESRDELVEGEAATAVVKDEEDAKQGGKKAAKKRPAEDDGKGKAKGKAKKVKVENDEEA